MAYHWNRYFRNIWSVLIETSEKCGYIGIYAC